MIKRLLKTTSLTILLVLSLVLPSIAVSQASSIEWEKTYSGISGDSLVQTFDGGFAIAATVSGQDEVLRVDKDGNVLWNITIGASAIPDKWIWATLDGGCVIARRPNNSSIAASLIKINAEGKVLWNQSYELGYEAYLNQAIQAQDGFTLIGSISTPEETQNPTWIMKTDSGGNKQWNITYNNFTGSVIAESNAGYVFAGDSNGQNPWLLRAHLAKIDYSGVVQWEKVYEDQSGYRPRSLLPTRDGGFVIAGARYFQNLSASAFALRTDTEGNLEWTKTYGENSGFRIALEDRNSQSYLFAGGIYDSQQHFSARLVNTDSQGNVEWEKKIVGKGNSYVYSLIPTSDGGYAFTGATGPADSSATEVWLVKLAATQNEPTQTNLILIATIILIGAAIAVLLVLVYQRRKKQ